MRDFFIAAQIRVIKIAFVNQSHHVIDRIFVHGQTGKAIFFENGKNFVHVGVHIHRHNVYARHQNIFHFQIVEFQRGTHKFRFVLFQRAVLFRFVHKRNQLFVRYRVVRLQPENAREQFFIRAENDAERRKYPVKELNKRVQPEREFFGIYAREIFRRNFAENQHSNRHYRRGDGSRVQRRFCEQLRKQYRSKRRSR